MNIARNTMVMLILLFTIGCQPVQSKSKTALNTVVEKELLSDEALQEYETAYFAAGCFWCVEAIFESVKGVKEAVSGYAGGVEKNPNYEDVGYGRTGHAETVQVFYNPKEISFQQLVMVFFGSHDPTTLNRQGPDKGPQYRSIAFYKNEQEQKIITNYIALLTSEDIYQRPIVTEVSAFDQFYKAEAYHQDFERRNPNNSYVKAVSIPRLNRFKENFKSFLKEEDSH